MTTGLIDDSKRLRDRAHEARIRAGELNDPEAKRQMLGIARGYDRLAERAEGDCGRRRLPSLRTEPRTFGPSRRPSRPPSSGRPRLSGKSLPP